MRHMRGTLTPGLVHVKLAICASLAGCAAASWPFLIFRVDSESALVDTLQWLGKLSMMPGIVVGFVAAGGNGHIMNFWIMTVANGAFYAAISYRLLVRWERRTLRPRGEESAPSGGDRGRS